MTEFIVRIEEESIPVLIAYNQWNEADAEGGLDSLKQQLLSFIERLHKDCGVILSSGDYIEPGDGEIYGIAGRRVLAKGDGFEVRFTVFETTRYAEDTKGSTEQE